MTNELLVPRKAIHFTPLEEGRFVSLCQNVPELLKQPHARTNSGPLVGFESGYRSGLLRVDGQLYKLKGCRPEGGVHGKQPLGSQTLSLAQSEADAVARVRERFIEAGLDYPLEPMGLWVYENILHEGEPNAATVYRAKGDTRLDEFLWFLEHIPYQHADDSWRDHIFTLAERAGQMTGGVLKVLHDNRFSWDSTPDEDSSNAHAGNVLIFPQGNTAQFGIVDFDNVNSYSDSEDSEYIETVKVVQQRDLNNLKNHTHNGAVFSSSNQRISRPHNVPSQLVERLLKGLASDMPKDDLETASFYLLRSLGNGKEGSVRGSFVRGLDAGYKDGSAGVGINWRDLSRIRSDIPRLRRAFIEEVRSRSSGLNRERVIHIARQYKPFRNYRLPVVVDIEDHTLLEGEDPISIQEAMPDERKQEIVSLVDKLIRLHEAYLVQHSSVGERFFTFPIIPKDILEEHAQITSSDAADFVTLWMAGDLRRTLVKTYPPRAIGSFLLTLAQTAPNYLTDALLAAAPGKDDPRLMEKLIHMEELSQLLLVGAIKNSGNAKKLNMYVSHLIEKRLDAFRIRKEAEKRAAISLFGMGIITEPLEEIFNHMLFAIILTDFDNEQLEALEAAQTQPRIIDQFGPDHSSMLKLALTAVKVRNGQVDNLPLVVNQSVGDFEATFLKYIFSSFERTDIYDETTRKALEVASAGWLDWTVRIALVTKKPIHPSSYFAQALKETVLKTDDMIDLVKTALDVSGGDLSTIDAVIQDFFMAGKFEGSISQGKAADLIQSCIGFGIELPAFIEPYLTPENAQSFMEFLGNDSAMREGHMYGHILDYPIHPIHALMFRGTQVLPEKIRDLFLENDTNQNIVNNIARNLLTHLFSHFSDGYFKNYFGTMFNFNGDPEYPNAAYSPRAIFQTDREMWRIVHHDIWALLNLADPQILEDFFKENLEEGIIEMEMRSQEIGLVGQRKTPINECLPPDLFAKAYPNGLTSTLRVYPIRTV